METPKIAGVIARKDLPPYALAFGAGLVTAFTLASINGNSEAWLAGNYFWLGIPSMCLCQFFISRRYPQRPWRWTVSMALGQVFAAILRGSSTALGPVAILFVLLLSIPQFLTGTLAAGISRTKALEPPQHDKADIS
ncbi:MAG: hypothetical protein RQ757_04045 [Pseudomonadales bacterium]|nr:hypothetical protein [Pseudomonadales bacterium]